MKLVIYWLFIKYLSIKSKNTYVKYDVYTYLKICSLYSHPKIIKDLIDYAIQENHTNLDDLEKAAK